MSVKKLAIFPECFFLASTDVYPIQLHYLPAAFKRGSCSVSQVVPVTALPISCHCFPTLATPFLYLCKPNEAMLKRSILNSEISQGKLQNLEGRDLIPGLEILCKIWENGLFLQNLGRKLGFDWFVLLSLESEN